MVLDYRNEHKVEERLAGQKHRRLIFWKKKSSDKHSLKKNQIEK